MIGFSSESILTRISPVFGKDGIQGNPYPLILACLFYCAIFGLSAICGKQSLADSSLICVNSSGVKKVVLEGGNERKPVVFEVPIVYMPQIYEREGKIKNSLTIAAEYKTLNPQCDFDSKGEFHTVEWMKKDKIDVSIVNSDAGIKIIDGQIERYSSPYYQKLDIPEYPDFIFYRVKARYNDYAVPKQKTRLPEPFLIQCIEDSNAKKRDIPYLGTCRLSFDYKGRLYITTSFGATHLSDINDVYNQTIKLINRFIQDK